MWCGIFSINSNMFQHGIQEYHDVHMFHADIIPQYSLQF